MKNQQATKGFGEKHFRFWYIFVVTPEVKINEIIDVKESISFKESINFASSDGNFSFAANHGA